MNYFWIYLSEKFSVFDSSWKIFHISPKVNIEVYAIMTCSHIQINNFKTSIKQTHEHTPTALIHSNNHTHCTHLCCHLGHFIIFDHQANNFNLAKRILVPNICTNMFFINGKNEIKFKSHSHLHFHSQTSTAIYHGQYTKLN